MSQDPQSQSQPTPDLRGVGYLPWEGLPPLPKAVRGSPSAETLFVRSPENPENPLVIVSSEGMDLGGGQTFPGATSPREADALLAAWGAVLRDRE